MLKLKDFGKENRSERFRHGFVLSPLGEWSVETVKKVLDSLWDCYISLENAGYLMCFWHAFENNYIRGKIID